MKSLRRSGSSTGAELLLVLLITALSARGDLLENTLETGERLGDTQQLAVIAVGAAGAAAARGLERDEGYRGFMASGLTGSLDRADDILFGELLPASSVGLWIAGTFTGDRRTLDTGEMLTRGLLYTYGAAGMLKLAVDRSRPDGSGFDSFPSAHAAGTACVAAALWSSHGETAGLPATAVAVYTCLSRVNLGRHHPSDVLLGAAIGTACGLASAAVDETDDGKGYGFSVGIDIDSSGRISPAIW